MSVFNFLPTVCVSSYWHRYEGSSGYRCFQAQVQDPTFAGSEPISQVSGFRCRSRLSARAGRTGPISIAQAWSEWQMELSAHHTPLRRIRPGGRSASSDHPSRLHQLSDSTRRQPLHHLQDTSLFSVEWQLLSDGHLQGSIPSTVRRRARVSAFYRHW